MLEVEGVRELVSEPEEVEEPKEPRPTQRRNDELRPEAEEAVLGVRGPLMEAEEAGEGE